MPLYALASARAMDPVSAFLVLRQFGHVNKFDSTTGPNPSRMCGDTHFKSMNAPTVTVNGRPGLIFEGEIPETYCFVPQECLSVDADGEHVNEIQYLRSGWDVRNMRCNETPDGNHLFPKTHGRAVKLDAAPVRHFLDRIKVAGGA